MILQTGYGEIVRDDSGMWHYRMTYGGDIGQAAEDAITNLPSTPSCFWFNGTYCPVVPRETPGQLIDRWYEWLEAEQAGKLVKEISEFAGIR